METTDARQSGDDRSRTVGEAVSLCLPNGSFNATDTKAVCAALGIDPATPLANIVALPLRDTERAVIDAAKKARVGRLSDLGHLWVTIDALLRAEADAMRATRLPGEGQ